ncbi:hypothetical protein JW826_05740 [Candidatus Woesearchaeota archaeon]|nr:hypothetical protein [Candidatus Woesearchaeota archaeon]
MRLSMFPKVFMIVLIVCALSLAVSADPLNILLRGPSDGSTTTSLKVEFIYGFDNVPEMKNCSLHLNGVLTETRGSLIKMENNRITTNLEAGEYDWFITCIDSEGNDLVSETRTLTVDIETSSMEGFEIIYNPTSLRSYLIPVFEGKETIVLPAMKAGEDIRIKTSKALYYLDVLKMGSINDNSFVEIRDRVNSRLQKIVVGEKLSFDLDDDGKAEVALMLEKVVRNVDAYFVVEPYPESTIVEEDALQEPEEEPVVPEETVEEEQETPVEAVPEDKPAEPETAPQTDVEETPAETGEMSPAVKYSIIIIVIMIILAAIFYTLVSRKKEPPKKEQPAVEEPTKESSEHHAHHSQHRHHKSFDVIRSDSRKRK